MAFNRDRNSRPGGDRGGFRSRPSFGDRGRSGGFSRGPVEMFKAVCDNCGKECEVPFRPTQGKPVFCSDCFRNQKEGADRPNNFRERSSEQPHREQSSGNEEQFRTINAKLDSILKILESVSEEVEEEEEIEEPIEISEPAKEIVIEKKKKASKKADSLPQE